ncbi:MAG TPA: PilZ domain-containing protein [Terriglobales bacterium]|nr:PilZ domain-containing protein [Terriglobales bacterium]
MEQGAVPQADGQLGNVIESSAERSCKRIHVALPVRVTYWDNDHHSCLEHACTYDISERGARIGGLRGVQETGEIVVVERGRNKVFCRVVWIGQPNSELRGLVGIECLENDKVFWEAELRDMEETYEPAVLEVRHLPLNVPVPGMRRNRRRYERFEVKGAAELFKNGSGGYRIGATLRNLSELGCLLTGERLPPGADLSLFLKVGRYDLSLKGQVRYAHESAGSGIEFHEIRKGDRQILQFLLRKLVEKELEDVFEFEIGR